MALTCLPCEYLLFCAEASPLTCTTTNRSSMNSGLHTHASPSTPHSDLPLPSLIPPCFPRTSTSSAHASLALSKLKLRGGLVSG